MILITPAEFSERSGLSPQRIKQLILDGVIVPKEKSGRNLLNEADIQKIAGFISVPQTTAVRNLIPVKHLNGYPVPNNVDLITTYEELRQYTLGFSKRRFHFLLLVGSPGSGKSRQMQADLEGTGCAWIDNHASNLGLYCRVYEAQNRPVVLDDVNHFVKDKMACSLIKALTQTEKERCVAWESTVKALKEREVPRQYKTSSPICLIANRWDASNADLAAIQDRAIPVAFFPSAETIHERVLELGWCDTDVADFVGRHLSDIPQPSMREYFNGMTYKNARMDWREKLLKIWKK